jgi:hypothetical protein
MKVLVLKIAKVMFVVLILSLELTIKAFSQEKKHEIVVGALSMDQFVVRYKFGNENRMFRINSTSFRISNSSNSDFETNDTELAFGLGLGIEYPKKVNDKLALLYGFSVSSSFANITDADNQQYSFGGGVILGSAYYFNDVLKLGVEIHPGIYYNNSKTGGTTTEKIGFGAENGWAEINLGFMFNR